MGVGMHAMLWRERAGSNTPMTTPPDDMSKTSARPAPPKPASAPPEAPRDCPLCPRLVAYRQENARAEPAWFNGAVPSFGDPAARLLIVGLAPGRTGANRTGRPFTGDYAGELLYQTLIDFRLRARHL